MWLFQFRDACWCSTFVENSNFNVTVILNLNWPSTTLGTNIETTFTQHCLNIVWMLVPDVGHRCWDNIHTALPEHCVNISPQRWAPMLRQHSHNVAWMLSQHWEQSHNIAWMLSSHWPMSSNIVTTLWQLWDFGRNTMYIQRSHNVVWTSTQCCWNV